MHAYMYVRGEEGGASLKNKKRKKKIPAPSGGHDCGRGKERHGRRCVHCTQSISPIFSFPSLFIDSHTSFSSLSRCNIYITSVFFLSRAWFFVIIFSSLMSSTLLSLFCSRDVLFTFLWNLILCLRLLCWSMWVAR